MDFDNNNNDDTTNFHNHNIKLIVPDEDGDGDGDGDESLSLCDFPINSDRKDSISKNNRRSSSEPADFFEFLNDFTSLSEISHAEDIFYCGKLVPYAVTHRRRFIKSLSEHNQYHSIDSSSTETAATTYTCDSLRLKSDAACCRRSSAPPRSRNLEHHRIPRQSDIRRSSSKSSAKSEASSRDSRPKWFVLMFGRPLKFQQELDFRGVRNRQIRRNPGSIFPGGGMDAGDGVPANRRNWRSFWSHDLLRALSCKDDASVAVTASVLVPHF